jgi:hypothetical protein
LERSTLDLDCVCDLASSPSLLIDVLNVTGTLQKFSMQDGKREEEEGAKIEFRFRFVPRPFLNRLWINFFKNPSFN